MEIRAKTLHRQWSSDELLQAALNAGEGVLAQNGALNVTTGNRTGRSPKDHFIVDDALTHDTVAWGAINQPLSTAHFDRLWEKALLYCQDKNLYSSDLQIGADENYCLCVTAITEFAWHQLFVQNLFIRHHPAVSEGRHWTLLCLPRLTLDPSQDSTPSDGIVILNFSKRVVLILGIQYAGEMKKAMFSVLNYLLPDQGVLPMHCSANQGEKGDVALFFGLSGTGKTTLSADPDRYLLGDDEHGWSQDGVFNFEGGCYAKCINLSEKNEPLIWHAIRKGAVMENVVLNQEGKPDYTNSRLTENTRVAYPLDFIPKRIVKNKTKLPETVIFLSCDLYGVLPPVALLTPEQAAYYFLSGYTALVGSTEIGSQKGIQPTFSTCFGAPFFPRPASVYAELLLKRIRHAGCAIYLVNTGWTQGSYGKGGSRFSIPVTRRMISAILNQEINLSDLDNMPGFNFKIPHHIEGLPNEILNPLKNFTDQKNFKTTCNDLIAAFQKNFEKYQVPASIKAAQPEFL